jgi:hypothetical protein
MDERSTSFSKNLEGLHHEENALDKTSPLKDKFEPAKEQDNQRGPHPVEPERGSDMVKGDAPHLRPTPSGPMRDIPDRYAAASKLGKEHDDADSRIRKAIEAKARQRGRERGQEKERER